MLGDLLGPIPSPGREAGVLKGDLVEPVEPLSVKRTFKMLYGRSYILTPGFARDGPIRKVEPPPPKLFLSGQIVSPDAKTRDSARK